MKVSIDIDCTPEEARRFMGLPDLAPIHEAYLSKMRSSIEQGGLSPDAMDAMLRSWAPMGEAGLAMWRQLIDSVGSAAAKS